MPSLSLTDRDAVTAALADLALDAKLRALIGLQVWQVDTDRRRALKDILQIVVVQPGDAARPSNPAGNGSTITTAISSLRTS